MISVRISFGGSSDWLTVSMTRDQLTELKHAMQAGEIITITKKSTGYHVINGSQINYYEVL